MPRVLNAAGGPLSPVSVLPQEVGGVDGGVDLKTLVTTAGSCESLNYVLFNVVEFTYFEVKGELSLVSQPRSCRRVATA